MPFSKECQPERRRGPSNSTLVARALKAAGHSEDALMKKIIERAFDDEDPQSAQLLKDLLARMTPPLKATVKPVEFDFPDGGSHADKIDAILSAVASGLISPDVAVMISGVVKTALDVRETTELVERMERLEALINAQAAK